MTDIPAFEPWPKVPRLSREIVITEKIDGSNCAIGIRPVAGGDTLAPFEFPVVDGDPGGPAGWAVRAQSRKRLIVPGDDNFGFAWWAWNNATLLAKVLGEGLHFGEWWGQGIQRRYGMEGKRFSLFNTKRWGHLPSSDSDADIFQSEPGDQTTEAVGRTVAAGLRVVPEIGWGDSFDTVFVDAVLRDLESHGSVAAPGFMRPEGVVVFQPASQTMFKKLIGDADQIPKGVAA